MTPADSAPPTAASPISQNMRRYLSFAGEAARDSEITGEVAAAAMFAAAAPDIEIVEPGSLPQGGVHRGHAEWARLIEQMHALWEQHGDTLRVWEVPDEDLIIVYTAMDWTAKATGKRIQFPAIQLLRFRDGLIAKVEIFHQDVATVVATLT